MMTLAQYLETSTWAFPVIAGILGLIVGSFLNVVIHRLPIMLERQWRSQCYESFEAGRPVKEQDEPFDLARPPSHCPACNHAISPWENIPVISYILLRGRCAGCQTPISPRYLVVELLSGALAVVVALQFGFGWQALTGLLLTWSLVALSFIDLDHQILPDVITLPFLWIGLLLSLYGVFADTHAALVGAALGYLLLWGVYHAFRLVTGKEGMGYGDFKLLALLGAWLGWQSIPLIILLSSIGGALVGVAMVMLRGRDKNLPMPFGPYLAAAGWVALLWGEAIMQNYLNYATGL